MEITQGSAGNMTDETPRSQNCWRGPLNVVEDAIVFSENDDESPPKADFRM